MSEKMRNFCVYDDAVGTDILVGDIPGALEYVKAYLEHVEDGERHTLEIVRRDMTEAEIAAAPEA